MGLKNKFHQIFEIIAKVNGLREIDDNVYLDPNGIFFYLDEYGFHTQNQFANNELIRKNKVLDRTIKRYNQLEINETLSDKSRKKIRKILKRPELPNDEKIRLLKINMKINDK
jgi:hypothetical protein